MAGKRQDPFYQAQAILSLRDHSRSELTAKLRRKGFGEQEIAKTLAWLQEQKLLDDRRFAQTYVESILRGKPVGPRYLSAKLQQKGVADDIIREVISTAFQSPATSPRSRESELIKQAIDQWRRIHPKYAQDQQRLYRFLITRGFTIDAIALSALPPADA